jgi:site-specific recombinase XerD
MDDAHLSAYVRGRLRKVRAKSVKSELSAARSLARWLVEMGHLAEMPTFPEIDHSKLGVAHSQRRRVAAPDLTPAEVRKVLAKLPLKARSGWWVRPRCELLYETGLRPATVDALSVPEHWSPGAKTLRITDDIDKEGFAREVPLTKRALALLKRCAPKEGGVIFGEHRYDWYVRPAAKVLAKAKAAVFTGQHLRSARATHLLDAGAPLTGVQHILGHNNVSTTARYVRPSLQAAAEALRAVR